MKNLSELDCFGKLGDDDDKSRYIASLKISNIFDEESINDEKRGALRRIISGLGGSKHHVRCGSYAVLKYCLTERPNDELLNYDNLSKLIKNCLQAHADSKQEDGEAYLGQLLAYKAMVSSVYLKSHPENYEPVAMELAELLKKRSYLNGECFSVLALLVPQLDSEIESEKIVEVLQDLTQDSSEKLMYLMALDDRFPKSKTVKRVFNTKRLFAEGNAPSLASCILGGSCLDSKDKTAFYDALCKRIVENQQFLSGFWEYCCSQVASTRNHNVETLLIRLFVSMLNTAVQLKLNMNEIAKTLFNDVVIGLLVNPHAQFTFKQFSRNLRESLVQAMNVIDDEKVRVIILKKLLFPPGCLSFDKMTRSKAASTLMNALSSQSVKDVAKKLSDSVQSPHMINKDKLTALNLFNGLLNHRSCFEDTDWRVKQMKSLLDLGFRTQTGINAELADLIRKTFFSSLSSKFPRLQVFTEVLQQLVTHLNDLIKSGTTLRIKADEETHKTWNRGMKLLKKMSKNESVSSDLLVSLKILTQYILLTVFNEGQDCELNLQDIESVFQKHGSSDAVIEKDGSAGAHWSEVLVDLLLNLLSKTSSSNRHIVGVVFKHVAPHMNDSAFMLLMNVMDPEKSALKDDDDDDMEEKDGESDDDDSESDEDGDDEEDDDEEDVEIEEASSDGESDGDPTYYENLQRELRQVLYSHDTDNESVDVDDIDEERGKALNKSLGEVFRNAMKQKKNRQSTREGRTTHFRCRVLDLLEIYCKTIPTAHCLTLIPTLVDLHKFVITRKQDASLQQRLTNFAEKLSSQKNQNFKSSSEESINQLAQLLQSLIAESTRSSSVHVEIRPFLLCFIKFIISNASSMDTVSNDVKHNVFQNVIQEAFDQFFSSKKDIVHARFFTFLNQSNWEGTRLLIPKAVQYAFSTELKYFKQEQAFKLIVEFLKNTRRQPTASKQLHKTVRKLEAVLCSALDSASDDLDRRLYPLIVLLYEELFNNGKLTPLIEDKPALLQSLRNCCSTGLKIDQDTIDSLVETCAVKNKWKWLWKELQTHAKKKVNGQGGLSRAKMDEKSSVGQEEKPSLKRKKPDARKLKKMSKKLRAEVSELEPGLFSRLSGIDPDARL